MGHLVDYRDNYYDLNAFSTTFYNFSRKVVRAYFLLLLILNERREWVHEWTSYSSYICDT